MINIKRFLLCIYGFAFFDTLTLILPVNNLFMAANGIGPMLISIIIIAWSVGAIIGTVPATRLACRMGIRNSLFLGQCLKAAAFVIFPLCPTFWGFTVAMIIWGMQSAIYNTVFESLMYDELVANNRGNMYTHILAQRRNFRTVGLLLSASGSFFMFLGYEWLTVLSIISVLISMLFVMAMPISVKPHCTIVERGAPITRGRFRSLLGVLVQTPKLLPAFIVCIIVAEFSYLDDYFNLIATDVGVPLRWVGAVTFSMMLCTILGQALAGRFTKIRAGVLSLGLIISGGLYMLFVVCGNIWGLGLLALAYIMVSAIRVWLYSNMMDKIPSGDRLAILSLYNIGTQLTYFIVCLIIGIGGSVGRWGYGTFVLGVILCIVGIQIMIFLHNMRSRRIVMPDNISHVQ